MIIDQTQLGGSDPRLILWCLVQASSAAYAKLTSAFGSAEAALCEPISAWSGAGVHSSHVKRLSEPKSSLKQLEQTLLQLRDQRFWVSYHGDPDYPALLCEVADAPAVLFGRGRQALLADPHLAVVGTRSPTPSARATTEQFVQMLSRSGLSIVSGLAAGIDAVAHAAALKAAPQTSGAQTVAVMGCGVDLCYPPSNQKLLEDVLDQGGTVISEYLPGTRALKHHFPRRNRIISGMSMGTLVIEAAQRSGSLITASMAAEFGRSVFAVPGFIGNQKAVGCHDLIRGGATLCYQPEQVLEDLSAQIKLLIADQRANAARAGSYAEHQAGRTASNQLHKRAQTTPLLQSKPEHGTREPPRTQQDSADTPLLAALSNHALSLDELVSQLSWPIPEIIEQLTLLEISGQITQQAGRYQRSGWTQ